QELEALLVDHRRDTVREGGNGGDPRDGVQDSQLAHDITHADTLQKEVSGPDFGVAGEQNVLDVAHFALLAQGFAGGEFGDVGVVAKQIEEEHGSLSLWL